MRLPDSLRKGLILYGDRTHKPAESGRLVEYGVTFESEGKTSDALEFFRQAGFTEGMERIARRSVDEGDFFLYRQAMVYLERAMTADDLSALSKAAEGQGKLTFALAAAREAGDNRLVAALEAKIGKDEADEETHQS